jgi:hypothetical protein
MTSGQRRIVEELYCSLVLLGADSSLLGTVGSWGDCLPEEEVLSGLEMWNRFTFEKLKGCIEHYEISCRRSDCIQGEARKIVEGA